MDQAYILAFIVAIMWGIGTQMERHVLQFIDTKTLYIIMGFTLACASLVISVIYRKPIMRDFKQSTSYIYFAILTGLIAIVISGFIFQKALSLSTTKNVHCVTAIAFAAPVVTMLVSILYFKEKLTIKSMVGVVLVSLGVLLVV